MSIKRKLFKIAWISAAVLAAVVLVIAVILWLTVDADMIESVIERQISRRVEIGGIRAGLFSAVSGFSVQQLLISNRWSRERIDSEEDIGEDEIFMRMGSLKLELEFWPLLRRHLRVRSLLISQPEIRLVRFADGSLSVSDLMTERPSDKGMEAGDLPLSLDVESIRVSDGVLLFEDRVSGSRFRIHSLNLEISDIRIDPRDLEQHNSLRIRGAAALESVLIPPGGFAQEVEAEFRMQGLVRPFDPETGLPAPQARLNLETPSGRIKGSALFARLRSSPLLSGFGVTPDFLPGDLDWKDGTLVLSVAGDLAEIEEGTFRLEGYGMNTSGTLHLKNESVSADLDLLLDRGLNEPVRRMLGTQADAVLSPDMRRYVSGDELAQALISVMQNEDEQIQLPFRISGTLQKPETGLKAPAAAALSAAAQRLLAEKAGSAGERAVKSKLTDTLKGLIKKK